MMIGIFDQQPFRLSNVDQTVICTYKRQRRSPCRRKPLIGQPTTCQLHSVIGTQRVTICHSPCGFNDPLFYRNNIILMLKIILKNCTSLTIFVLCKQTFAPSAGKRAHPFNSSQVRCQKSGHWGFIQQCRDPVTPRLGQVTLYKSTRIEIQSTHRSPLSSITISEAVLPGTCPMRSANAFRSSLERGAGGMGPSGRGRINPASTRIRTVSFRSSVICSFGVTWTYTVCRSLRCSGSSGRRTPSSYTANIVSVISSFTSCPQCGPRNAELATRNPQYETYTAWLIPIIP